MTFKQVLAIVWRRRVLAAAVAVLVTLATFLYGRYAPVSYTATTTLRYSAAATSALSGSSTDYGSIPLDLDPDFADSPEIAKAAADALGADATTIQASVTASMTEGVRANRLTITATGSTSNQARDRANAVAKAFTDHLTSQLNAGLNTLQKQLSAAQTTQTDALNALGRNAGDRLAQQNFNDSSAKVSQLQTEITNIQDAGAPVSIFEPATAGTRKGAGFTTIMLVGIVSGIIAGAGIALIREQFDDRLRTSSDIEQIIGGHVMNHIAMVPGKELRAQPLPVASQIPTPFNESIRSLRTSLQVIFPERHAVLAITSCQPGEGKTFISANLAVSMTRAGRSVILVEGDMRRPRLNRYFALPDQAPGFARAIAENASAPQIERLLAPTDFSGLRILPAGDSQHEPADLLASDDLHSVIGRLRAMADLVLVDTPPGLALADAAIIGGEADGLLVVTAINRTRRSSLQGTLQILRANRTNVVGVVANRSRRATVSSYVHYYERDAGAGRHEQTAPADRQDPDGPSSERADDQPGAIVPFGRKQSEAPRTGQAGAPDEKGGGKGGHGPGGPGATEPGPATGSD